MSINRLEDRIAALSGMEITESSEIKDGAREFSIFGKRFISEFGNDRLTLHLNRACLAKLQPVLQKEPRVLHFDPETATVEFGFNDDVDREFVYSYVRYAWKLSKMSEASAA